jgi:hypothetical protein
MHQSSQRVALAASETIPCSVAAGSVAKGVVSFSFNKCSTCVRKRGRIAQLILAEVILRAAARLPELVVDAWSIQIINRGAV